MSKKCTLFVCCPLRLYYSTASAGKAETYEKKYCTAKYKECPRYMLEEMEGMGGKEMPGTAKTRKPGNPCSRKASKA